MTTRRTLTPLPARPELTAALKRAADAWREMSSIKKKATMRAQRKSWVVGEMMLAHPEMSRETAERIYDEVSF